MELTLAPNPLHNQPQTLQIDKVATLIGENGSGKSSILRSIFSDKSLGNAYKDKRVVCFSSGQNENYSEDFSKYLELKKKKGVSLNLSCFYFDKSWAPLLIFLSTSLVRGGLVRQFLTQNGYADEANDINNDDLSTVLELSIRVKSQYVNRIKTALFKEQFGEQGTIRQTPFHRSLESFIEELIDDHYSFEKALRESSLKLSPRELLKVKFAAIAPGLELDEETWLGDEPAIGFFIQAINSEFIDKSSLNLTLKNNLRLHDLSDGEYQLLFLYALIDLFDADDTLFLLDEADSHLHYKNVEKLWTLLHGIKGHAITTTHLLDSISAKENRIEHLKVVEKGRINEDNKIKQLISRLSVLSRVKSVEFELCGKLPNIALLDDYNDWLIFTMLATRKGLDVNALSDVHAMKKSSSYATASETFGKGKIDWLHGLSKIESTLATTKIFLICDRDEAALEWNANDGVQVNGRAYRDLLSSIQWPRGINVSPFLLAWKRREIKNYLLSYTALSHHNVLDQINNGEIAQRNHLKPNNTSDNDDICRLNSKDVINPLINTEAIGLDIDRLQAYIDLIPPEEISEDITNMYNFIIGKL
jgi:ABC-type cobalamin/Fe3+-siderophores transport system ATPase subunit